MEEVHDYPAVWYVSFVIVYKDTKNKETESGGASGQTGLCLLEFPILRSVTQINHVNRARFDWLTVTNTC